MHNKPLSSNEFDSYIRTQFHGHPEELGMIASDVAFNKLKKIIVGAVRRQYKIDNIVAGGINNDYCRNRKALREKEITRIVQDVKLIKVQSVNEASQQISKGKFKFIDSFVLSVQLFASKIKEANYTHYIFDDLLAFEVSKFRINFLTPASTKRFLAHKLFAFYEEMLGVDLILTHDRSDKKSAGPFQDLYVTAEFILQDICERNDLHKFKVSTPNTTYNFLISELKKYKNRKSYSDIFPMPN